MRVRKISSCGSHAVTFRKPFQNLITVLHHFQNKFSNILHCAQAALRIRREPDFIGVLQLHDHGEVIETVAALVEEEVLAVIEKVLTWYKENGTPGERFADTITRIGFAAVEAATR